MGEEDLSDLVTVVKEDLSDLVTAEKGALEDEEDEEDEETESHHLQSSHGNVTLRGLSLLRDLSELLKRLIQSQMTPWELQCLSIQKCSPSTQKPKTSTVLSQPFSSLLMVHRPW